VIVAMYQFRQNQIRSSSSRVGPSSHRSAKTRAGRLCALHGYYEDSFPPSVIDGIPIPTVEEHPILNPDGRQFARAHAEGFRAGA
jgi:hypothetical protein